MQTPFKRDRKGEGSSKREREQRTCTNAFTERLEIPEIFSGLLVSRRHNPYLFNWGKIPLQMQKQVVKYTY